MKLINSIVKIMLDDNKWLLVNTLNGLIDVIDRDTNNILSRWGSASDIFPLSAMEEDLFIALKSRGYLVYDFDEEMRIKNKLLLELRKNHNEAKGKFSSVVFILTYDCNFRCDYCFEANNPRSKNTMTPEMIDVALASQAGNYNSIGLFGGEPLLPKNRKLIEYIISKAGDVTYNITTNGYYLLEFFDLLNKLDIGYIQVTLDGNREIHDSRRYMANKQPTYDKIINGVKKYLENGKHVHIRMNLDSVNSDACKALRDDLSKSFILYEKKLSFEMQPVFQTDSIEKRDMYMQLYKNDADGATETITARNRILGTSRPIINYFYTNKPPSPLYCFCDTHSRSVFVDPEGDMYSCILSVGKAELSIGKYYPVLEFKDKSIMNRSIENIDACQKCNYAFLCGGGCPLSLPDYYDIYKPCCDNTLNDIHTLVPYLYKLRYEKR